MLTGSVGIYRRETVRAGRRLLRTPSFLALSVITVAFAVAPSLVFEQVAKAVLPPLPYPHSERLVALWQRADFGKVATSYPKLELLRRRSRTLDVAAFKWITIFNTDADQRIRMTVLAVTPAFFATLGAKPLLGRLFTDDEDRVPLQRPLVVISERFWRERLDARPDVVGHAIRLNDVAFTVVGVMRADFPGWSGVIARWIGFAAEDAWIPSMMAPVGMLGDWRTAKTLEEPMAQIWAGVGRIRDGFTAGEVRADLKEVGAEVQRIWPVHTALWPVPFMAVPLAEEAVDPKVVRFVSALQWAGMLVGLLGAVNVGSLFAARLRGRHNTTAIEWTLGASRPLLLWGMLNEAAVVGVLGGLAAAGLVQALLLAASRLEPAVVAFPFGVALERAAWDLSWRLAGFAFGSGIAVAGLGCALPAWRATRSGLLGFSRAGAGITGHGLASLGPNRSGGRLVIAELTFALALTAPSLLLVRSVARLVTADLGFDSSGIATLPLSLPVSEYEAAGAASFFARAVDAVSGQQGVARAAWVDGLPLTGSYSAQLQRSGSPQQQVTAVVRVVSPGAFATLGIPLKDGRDFDGYDKEGAAPVVVISELGARRLSVHVGDSLAAGSVSSLPAEVVGIAADVPYDDPVKVPVPAIYLPLAQAPRHEGVIVARSTGGSLDPGAILSAAVSGLDRRLGPLRPAPLREHVDRQLARFRVAAWLLGAAAAVALLLAGAGVHGVLSALVTRAVPEIAIRISMGATPRSIARRLLTRTLALAMIGLGGGTAIGLAISKPLESYVYGISRWDAWTMVLAAVISALLALLAAAGPARRAMRLDLVAALRSE